MRVSIRRSCSFAATSRLLPCLSTSTGSKQTSEDGRAPEGEAQGLPAARQDAQVPGNREGADRRGSGRELRRQVERGRGVRRPRHPRACWSRRRSSAGDKIARAVRLARQAAAIRSSSSTTRRTCATSTMRRGRPAELKMNLASTCLFGRTGIHARRSRRWSLAQADRLATERAPGGNPGVRRRRVAHDSASRSGASGPEDDGAGDRDAPPDSSETASLARCLPADRPAPTTSIPRSRASPSCSRAASSSWTSTTTGSAGRTAPLPRFQERPVRGHDRRLTPAGLCHRRRRFQGVLHRSAVHAGGHRHTRA